MIPDPYQFLGRMKEGRGESLAALCEERSGNTGDGERHIWKKWWVNSCLTPPVPSPATLESLTHRYERLLGIHLWFGVEGVEESVIRFPKPVAAIRTCCTGRNKLTLLERGSALSFSSHPADVTSKQQACILPQPIYISELIWCLFSCACFVGLKETFGLWIEALGM